MDASNDTLNNQGILFLKRAHIPITTWASIHPRLDMSPMFLWRRSLCPFTNALMAKYNVVQALPAKSTTVVVQKRNFDTGDTILVLIAHRITMQKLCAV
jgi:hypothetical protein